MSLKFILISGIETAKCFGGGLKGNALFMHFSRHIKPGAKLILDALARGEDPLETVTVDGVTRDPRSSKS
jgi:hypothetical protein